VIISTLAQMPKDRMLGATKTALYGRLRRLRMTLAKLGGTHTAAEWNHLQEQCGHRCAGCGIKSKKLTKDHVVPVSKGGSDAIENIRPMCNKCNARKGNRA
jgi:5-methylcytosine-specific restriction endonuclease McrA